jgi:hypothetical protein
MLGCGEEAEEGRVKTDPASSSSVSAVKLARTPRCSANAAGNKCSRHSGRLLTKRDGAGGRVEVDTMDGRRLGGGLRSERGLVGHAERVVRGRRPAEVLYTIPRTAPAAEAAERRERQGLDGRGQGLAESSGQTLFTLLHAARTHGQGTGQVTVQVKVQVKIQDAPQGQGSGRERVIGGTDRAKRASASRSRHHRLSVARAPRQRPHHRHVRKGAWTGQVRGTTVQHRCAAAINAGGARDPGAGAVVCLEVQNPYCPTSVQDDVVALYLVGGGTASAVLGPIVLSSGSAMPLCTGTAGTRYHGQVHTRWLYPEVRESRIRKSSCPSASMQWGVLIASVAMYTIAPGRKGRHGGVCYGSTPSPSPRISHLDNPVVPLALCNRTKSIHPILCAMPEHGRRDATASAGD